jgi:hypothetical protein
MSFDLYDPSKITGVDLGDAEQKQTFEEIVTFLLGNLSKD